MLGFCQYQSSFHRGAVVMEKQRTRTEHAATAVLNLLVLIANCDLTAEPGSGATIRLTAIARLLHLGSGLGQDLIPVQFMEPSKAPALQHQVSGTVALEIRTACRSQS